MVRLITPDAMLPLSLTLTNTNTRLLLQLYWTGTIQMSTLLDLVVLKIFDLTSASSWSKFMTCSSLFQGIYSNLDPTQYSPKYISLYPYSADLPQ